MSFKFLYNYSAAPPRSCCQKLGSSHRQLHWKIKLACQPPKNWLLHRKTPPKKWDSHTATKIWLAQGSRLNFLLVLDALSFAATKQYNHHFPTPSWSAQGPTIFFSHPTIKKKIVSDTPASQSYPDPNPILVSKIFLARSKVLSIIQIFFGWIVLSISLDFDLNFRFLKKNRNARCWNSKISKKKLVNTRLFYISKSLPSFSTLSKIY